MLGRPLMADDRMVENDENRTGEKEAANQNDVNMSVDIPEDDDDVDVTTEEFMAINSQLDELNSALDEIEAKNNRIQKEFMELLESNREARQHFQDLLSSVGITPEQLKSHIEQDRSN